MGGEVNISINYGDEKIQFKIPEKQLIFTGKMNYIPPLKNLNEKLCNRLKSPTGCRPLSKQVQENDEILILIEDNTRKTPVKKILPILIKHLINSGIKKDDIIIMTAPGTHRVMTNEEIVKKVGRDIADNFKIIQHDYTDKTSLINLGEVNVNGTNIPIVVNENAIKADFIIGIGNIIPHADAGFSGGAKIVEPGICGYSTTAATHITAALQDEIPLGLVNNPCRQGIEKVTRKVGLNFIINTVKNYEGEVVDIVAGDFVSAHREGVKIVRKSYGIKIPEPADIVIVSSFPCDLDWWQADKGLISAYFTVKKGGTIIFVTPCFEGLEHNHPQLRKWLQYSYQEGYEKAKQIDPQNKDIDLIAADLAISNAKIREKANILLVSDGLTIEESKILGYHKFENLKLALKNALNKNPEAKIGILPRGGDCLPIVN